MAAVYTDQGARVTPRQSSDGRRIALSAEAAEQDAKARNARAEKLGIVTRYVAGRQM